MTVGDPLSLSLSGAGAELGTGLETWNIYLAAVQSKLSNSPKNRQQIQLKCKTLISKWLIWLIPQANKPQMISKGSEAPEVMRRTLGPTVPWENLICVRVWSYQRSGGGEILSGNTFIIATSYCTAVWHIRHQGTNYQIEVWRIIISILSGIGILLLGLSECLLLIKQPAIAGAAVSIKLLIIIIPQRQRLVVRIWLITSVFPILYHDHLSITGAIIIRHMFLLLFYAETEISYFLSLLI